MVALPHRVKGLERLKRALREAEYLFNQRSNEDKGILEKAANAHVVAGVRATQTFKKLENNPCKECSRCCTDALFSIGYHTHSERQALLTQGVNLLNYVVPEWKGEPENRCLFLKASGCNIPPGYRSGTCLGYVCYDRLAPAIRSEGLGYLHFSANDKLKDAQRSLHSLGRVQLPLVAPQDFGSA